MQPGNTPRILIRADSPAQTDLRPHLERAGYVVAAQSLDGPDPEATHTFQLILIDSSQRHRDAQQLCRRLRYGLTDSFVPLLVLTSDTDPAARLAILECGADACLPRPFAPGELLAQVRAFLR